MKLRGVLKEVLRPKEGRAQRRGNKERPNERSSGRTDVEPAKQPDSRAERAHTRARGAGSGVGRGGGLSAQQEGGASARAAPEEAEAQSCSHSTLVNNVSYSLGNSGICDIMK